MDAKGTGAGGAFITVKDIANFWIGLSEGKLISKAMVSDMLKKQSGDGSDQEEGYYGYGAWASASVEYKITYSANAEQNGDEDEKTTGFRIRN